MSVTSQATVNPLVQGSKGMVVAAHPLASLAGTEMLLRGGNAVDAAVATAFALNVVEPTASCVGGGGFMIIYSAETGEVTALDYREAIPALARPGMYEVVEGQKSSEGWTLVKNDAHMVGHLAVATPASVAGLMYALEHFGAMKRDTVLAPAIRYAEQGFPVYAQLAQAIQSNMHKVGRFPGTKAVYMNGDRHYEVGETLCQRDLGKTLRAVAERGTKGFYEGWVAEAIAQEMEANDGILSLEDLRLLPTRRPRVMRPAEGVYRGYRVMSMPPPSSGGTHLVQMLNILEHFDMPSFGHNSPQSIHLLSEVMKRAFADREKYMGDPDFVDVPVRGLTSKEYADELAALLRLDTITHAPLAGDPTRYGRERPAWPDADDNSRSRKRRAMGPGCTTHFSVVDEAGNMVASTQTINDAFGCGVVVPGTGIKLNDQMENTEPTPGRANSIEPWKSPLSSMSPTLVIAPDGLPLLTAGSPGSARIFSTVLQIVINVIDHGMNIQEAIEAPRIYAPVDEIAMEARIDLATRKALEEMGHRLDVRGEWDVFFGGAHGIQRDRKTGYLIGGADPRRSGRAIGY